LGIPSSKNKKMSEVSPLMTIPMIVLALLCIVFGVFAQALPLKQFILSYVPAVSYIGVWTPGLSTLFILLGLVIGFIIYLMGNLKGIREADAFIGGERLPVEERITGKGFYDTIREFGGLQRMYAWAEAKWFDVYEQGNRLVLGVASVFKKAHTGILTFYMMWVMVGLIVLLVVLMGR
jgi:NADH:ubiquinone oxidoreductase subunit 5 (subunit L)/multisubunit Na+/H+ antiporter MnhA subunit